MFCRILNFRRKGIIALETATRIKLGVDSWQPCSVRAQKIFTNNNTGTVLYLTTPDSDVL